MLPKYFQDLHLAVCAITGKPRIAKMKPGISTSDKYIDVPEEEWKAAVHNYFSMFEESQYYFSVLADKSFVFGGKAASKKNMLELLEHIKSRVVNEWPDDVNEETNE